MKKYLVIGNPVEHSLSPKLHNYWFKKNKVDAIYEKKQINLSGIKDIAEVGIKSKDLPDNFIQVLKEQSLFPPKSEPKKLKSIDLPISKINNYESYILKRSMEKLSQDLCNN